MVHNEDNEHICAFCNPSLLPICKQPLVCFLLLSISLPFLECSVNGSYNMYSFVCLDCFIQHKYFEIHVVCMEIVHFLYSGVLLCGYSTVLRFFKVF